MKACVNCGGKLTTFRSGVIKITPTNCPECSEKRLKEKADASRTELLNDAIQKSSLPKEYYRYKKVFESAELTDHQKKVSSYISEYDPCSDQWRLPFLYGPPGGGKTLIAYYAADKLIHNHIDSGLLKFTTVAELLSKMRNNQDDAIPYKATKFLITDDLCAHTTTNWVLEKLYMLLDYRIKHELPTLFTSNVKPTEVAAILIKYSGQNIQPHICEAIQDRILGLCVPMAIDNKSHRLERCVNEIKEVQKQYGAL